MEGQKKVILVTGSSGRIGTRVIDRFCRDYQIVGFDMVPPKHKNPNMEFIKMDLSSDESVRDGFKQVKDKYGDHIVSMIHLAAYYNFTGGHKDLYDKITVKGTERVLDNLQHFNCEQFIFSSTQLVMATCETDEKINEHSPVIPKWDYPISKVNTEKIISEKRGNIPAVILRIAGCYDDECHSIPISNQIQRIFEHQIASRVFPGDITHGAPFLHMDDLVDSIELSIRKRKELDPELILLIGEDRTMSMDQLQRRISHLIDNKEFSTIRVPKWFAKMGAWAQNTLPGMPETFIKPWMVDLADDNYILDVSLAERTIGWRPKHFIGDALPRMIDELKTDPSSWYEKNGLKVPSWLKRKLVA